MVNEKFVTKLTCILPISVFLWIGLIQRNNALIPRLCAYNVSRTDGACCPIPPGRAKPCGGEEVGSCLEFQVHHQYGEIYLNAAQRRDDRLRWPKRLFRYGCHCQGNYDGFACHECLPGWGGRGCRTRTLSVRRNVLSYTAAEKRLFQKVMVKSHHVKSDEYVILLEQRGADSDPMRRPRIMDVTLHQMLVFIHRYASRSTMYDTEEECARERHFDFNHGGVGFVTWHRRFMMFWENQAAKLAKKYYGVEDFRFPYWDWTDAKNCTVCTPDLVGDLSHPEDPRNPSPFRKWVEYCGESSQVQCNACHTRMLYTKSWPRLVRGWNRDFYFPTKSQVEFTLSRKYYYVRNGGRDGRCESFAHALEGDCAARDEKSRFPMHNGVHNAVNGPFSGAAGSTNDPLFPLHHLQIDRIFSAWFRRHQPHVKTMPDRGMKFGHCGSCNLVGIYPPIPHYMMLVDTRALGYEYDSLHFGKRSYNK